MLSVVKAGFLKQALIAFVALLGTALSGASLAAPIEYSYTARVDGSDRPGAPNGTLLTGMFSFDPDQVFTIGSTDYRPNPGSAMLSAFGELGFSLTRDTRAIVVTPGGANDTLLMQSFLSEDPNGWNMVFDFIEPVTTGWLNGSSALPESIPFNPANAFISLYFTDEGDWVRVVEATVLTVTRANAPVSAPATLWLVVAAVTGLLMRRRSSL